MKIADSTGHVTVIHNVEKEVFEKSKASVMNGGALTADIYVTGAPTNHVMWAQGHVARIEWSAK